MTLRLALAALTLGIVSAVPAADDPTQRVQFESGANSAIINGSVTGYRSLRYLLAARAGQTLSISFLPSKDSLYFNVVQGTHTLHDGSRDDAHDWAATAVADGDYVIDIYLKNSDARHNVQATFALTITVTNPTVSYRCADGRTVTVMYYDNPEPGSARLVVAGTTYELPHVVSASGARYAAGKVVWWNKGREATLELNGPATQCIE